jgi:hypothetical protein
VHDERGSCRRNLVQDVVHVVLIQLSTLEGDSPIEVTAETEE